MRYVTEQTAKIIEELLEEQIAELKQLPYKLKTKNKELRLGTALRELRTNRLIKSKKLCITNAK